jgi:hypothetical protein
VPSQTTSLDEIASVIRACGLPAELVDRGLLIDGLRLVVEVMERAHPTPADLARLSSDSPPASAQGVVVVAADRISEAGREVLRSTGVSWLDRRGHIRLWAPGLRLEMPFTPVERPRSRPVTSFTPAVRDVVFSMLQEPGVKPSPRRLGGILERSPGYVSTILTALAEDGLLDNDGHPLLPELFWALVDVWPRDWVLLTDHLDAVKALTPGAVVSGVHAASFWGAPVLVGEAETVQLSVAGQREMRRVLEHSTTAVRRSKARVAVRELGPSSRSASLAIDGEVVAHPLLCALDLGADQRSRETLEGWRATSTSLGVLAFIEIIQRTVNRPETWWLNIILRREVSVEVAESLVAWCWSNPECLALLLQNPNVPAVVRSTLRSRVDELSQVDERSLAVIVTSAPSLLLDETAYGSRFDRSKILPTSGGNEAWEAMERDIEAAFLGGKQHVSKKVRYWAETLISPVPEVSGRKNEESQWVQRRVAAYLLRFTEYSDLDPAEVALLRSIEAAADSSLAASHFQTSWTMWSSGDDPPWRIMRDKIATGGSLTSAGFDRLLREVMTLDLVDRAVPLRELLRVANPKWVPQILESLSLSAQAVTDLHVRAKVLAEASAFAASGQQRDELLNAALSSGRSAVYATTGSVLAGPEPGGVSGLLHVVPRLNGMARKSALRETVELWAKWLEPAIDSKNLSAHRHQDHRMLFGSPDNATEQLIRWLVEERLTAELKTVFSVIRRVAGGHGNSLEIMLAHSAEPALLSGDIEIFALLLSEARNPSPFMGERYDGEAAIASDGCPFQTLRFPDELIGFRNVWC